MLVTGRSGNVNIYSEGLGSFLQSRSSMRIVMVSIWPLDSHHPSPSWISGKGHSAIAFLDMGSIPFHSITSH